MGAPSAAPAGGVSQRWVLAATVLASGMAFIDGTVVNIALPLIQESLGASGTAVQWIVEAYSLFFSALILVGGAMGDRFGRRRVFMAGVTLFALASAACGLARNVSELITARAIQGIGASLLVPGSLAILSAAFPAGERGRAIGTWSAFTSVATSAGPLLGAWLVQTVSWRAAFLLNLPLAAAVLFIAWRHLPETRDPAARPLDITGAALATAALGGVVLGLIESVNRGWRDPWVVGALLAGVIALVAFVFEERRSRNPMLPPSLFRERTFVAANLLTLFLYAALSAAFFYLPFDLLQAQEFTPAEAGAAMMPLIVLLSSLSMWSGGFVQRVGARLPLTLGPAIAGLGFGLLALPGVGAGYWSGFFPALCVLGLGMGVTVAPLTTVVMNSVPREQAGSASGVNNAVARVAGLLAIALFGIVVSWTFHRTLERSLNEISVSPAMRRAVMAESSKLGATRPPAQASPTEAAQIADQVKASLVASFRVVTLIAAALALAASACAGWGLKSPAAAKASGSPRGPG